VLAASRTGHNTTITPPHPYVPQPTPHNECWWVILPRVLGAQDPGDALQLTEVRLAGLYANTSEVSIKARCELPVLQATQCCQPRPALCHCI